MTLFNERYEKLNANQRKAVDTINGPLLVVAGPGTGKTELLSMRAANILRLTDTLPSNILCLTFTETGASAMRERLAGIIGPEAYKVAIHTFHSFGVEVMNQHAEAFYRGADFQPADELTSHRILTTIFNELDLTNPLATKYNDNYVYLRDAATCIGELKKAGLSSDELLGIISANETVLDELESTLSDLFASSPSISMLEPLGTIAERASLIATPPLPVGITPLSNIFALSLARAIETALDTKKTTAITAWRNEWLEKNSKGKFVFKDRKRHEKLRALAAVYFSYLSRMEQESLYDFDDMILNIVHAIETNPELRYNLQEKYQYIMVDEFQDTNLAQLRILFDLTATAVDRNSPNVMAVGDDDQAIYSFQGADVNNITTFIRHYGDTELIPLIDNYRSAAPIITHSREVITQSNDRLESIIETLDKTLIPHIEPDDAHVDIAEHQTILDERAWIASDIASRIQKGEATDSIAVIARQHSELVALVPYLIKHDVPINYERRENVLDSPVVKAVELVARIVTAITNRKFDYVDGRLIELLAHPALGIAAEKLWRMSLTSYKEQQTWLELLEQDEELRPVFDWLIKLAAESSTTKLERLIDLILGIDDGVEPSDRSPLYDYYFSESNLYSASEQYVKAVEELRTIRNKLREYNPNQEQRIDAFIEFIDSYRALGVPITAVRQASTHAGNGVNLLTAHKSKGLEFDTVYVINSVDTSWGERARHRSRTIAYPANIAIAPAGDSYDERIRLFFVAMTRAKMNLLISHSAQNENAKPTLVAGFLVGTTIGSYEHPPVGTASQQLQDEVAASWHDRLTISDQRTIKNVLAPHLETYKLPVTHLNNFIDVTRGGPSVFLLQNLLRMPAAKSASASYGTAVHATLQKAHNHMNRTGTMRPLEDSLKDFETALEREHLDADDARKYQKKGIESLTAYFIQKADTFHVGQKTELSFGSQNIVLNGARLTGSLDLVDITDNSVSVIDYKTGKPSASWHGKTDMDKIKLHKYKQQLMFYELLVKHSRDYSRYKYSKGTLQFVEPASDGEICALDVDYTSDELARFQQLISAVWQSIMNLDFPDTSEYPQNYKGIIEFEQALIDKYS